MQKRNYLNTLINRNNKIFDESLLKIYPKIDITKFRNTIFTYFDTYGGKEYPEFPIENRIIKLVPRKISNYISDKKMLGQLIDKYNLNNIFPKTHFDINSALKAYQKNKSMNLAYIKNRYGTGGKQVRCINSSDIQSVHLSKDEIIQEEVQNIFLINSRKITIRLYLIIFDKCLLLSKYAWGMIHGEVYEKNNPNYDIQIKHEGYINKNSKIKMFPLEESTKANQWFNSSAKKIRESSVLYEEIRLNTNKDNYIILGIDGIPTQKNDVMFIEVNSYPNFYHVEKINNKVNIPMISSVINLIMGEENSSEFIQV